MQSSKTKQQHTSYLWDGNRQLQQNTATHTHTIIYEQDSFEPVAQFIWLRDGLTAANDEPESYQENQEGWYGNNKPVIKTGVQLYHYHNDHLGTPNELTDQQGDVVWYADYEAWGNTATVEWKSQRIDNIVVSEEHLQPIRFQGQSFDTETGLHYNRFRYFDPDLGMFTSRDPIGLLGGSNVFQYAPNPTGWIDPFGLSGGELGNIQESINGVLKSHLPQIQALDPNATVGYRGSAASGISKIHDPTISRPINLNNFDVDAFISSDHLASNSVYTNRRRDASRIAALASIEESIEKQLRALLPGLRDEKFGFRIFKPHELADLARKGDKQVHVGCNF